ncbi:MAG: polysaccharide deacetylase family protein [Treponema sp.]|nr:polysaccharide deacetylase family protein [Treponema sp.]
MRKAALALFGAVSFGLFALPPNRLVFPISPEPVYERMARPTPGAAAQAAAMVSAATSTLAASPAATSTLAASPAATSTQGFAASPGTSTAQGPGVLVAGLQVRPFSVDDFENRALVLAWHTFLGKPQFDTDFTLAEFAAQLDAIRALGYSFPTVDDFLSGNIRGRKNVIVTIDDGNHSVPAAIRQVLLPRGIIPTLFVYPAVLGTTFFSMTDTQLAAFVAEGIPAGAHGYHHLRVTESLYRESPREFMDEIFKSKARAEALSKSSILAYAYPYGALSPRTEVELAKAGFAAAFAVRPGFVFADKRLDELYDLPRLVVLRSAWKDILALLARNAAGGADGDAGADQAPGDSSR